MITPIQVVQQLKENTKVFKLIGFTAELKRILDEDATYSPTLPAAFVCFKGSTTSSNTNLNGYFATEELDVSIYITLDNSTDFTGSGGMCITYTDAIADLRKCLMNWVPNERATMPFSYDGSDFVIMTGSRIIYEIKFSLEEQLTEQDGYIPTYDDLQEIDLTEDFFKDQNLVEEIETVSSLNNP